MALRAVQSGTGRVRTGVRGGSSIYALLADFSSGTAPSSLVYSRSSQATAIDASGNVVYGPNNLALWSEDLTQSGAWVVSSGVTVSGTPGLQSNLLTVTAGNGRAEQTFSSLSGGASYLVSAYAQKSNTNYVRFRINVNGSVGSAFFNIATGAVGTINGLTGTPANITNAAIVASGSGYRISAVLTMAPTFSTAIIGISPAQTDGAASVAFDSVYAGGVQVSQVTAAQTAPVSYLKTTSAAAYGPRFTYVNGAPAFLPEGATTNQIRNSTMQGAVVGSPGTWPTNWTNSAQNISSQVVATGTINGKPYIDIRWTGTPTATSAQIVTFDTILGVAGQTWTNSVDVALVAGSLTNIASFLIRSNGEGTNTTFTPTGTLTRVRDTATLASTNPSPAIRWNYSNTTTAVDFTLRFAAPQSEQAPSQTSIVPTYGTALSRAAEVAYLDVSNLGLSSAGYTIVQKGYMPADTTGTDVLLSGFDGSNNVGLNFYATGPTFTLSASDTGGATGGVNITSGLAAGASYRFAVRVQAANLGAAVNGASGVTSTAIATPRLPTKLYLGYYGGNGTAYGNAPISSVGVIASAAIDSQLQAYAQ